MKMKIAVCDDEPEICLSIEKELKKVFTKEDIKYEIDLFNKGNDLIANISKGEYDLLFLDIEIPDINGVEIGKYIRENLHDEIIQIAYVSSKEGYAMELFKVRPINFLVKPFTYEDIENIIKKLKDILDQDYRIFSYKKGYNYFKIPMSNIMYLEREKRKILIHKVDGDIDEFYGSMENAYGLLKNNNFLFIHKSYIVNYNYIKKLAYENLVMLDDRQLSISQSRRKAIRSMYISIKMGEL